MASSTLIVSLNASLSLAKTSKSTLYYTSSLPPCSCSINLSSKSFKFDPFCSFSQLGFSHFSHWSGLKHLGISISPKRQKIGKGANCRGKVVYASLFGVGAPEALVIGVVALLVFGPKGLAEVARNLGKTLRAFQPTIKELQEVSREFKNTLEREISLDDDPIETKSTSVSKTTNPNLTSSTSSSEESQTVPMVEPNGAVSSSSEGVEPSKAYSSEDYLKITEEQLTARQEALSSSPEPETVVQDVVSPPPQSTIVPESQPQAVQETANAATSAQKPENEL